MRFVTMAASLMMAFGLMAGNTASAVPSDLSFTVLRNGSPVGTHAYKFNGEGDNTKVDITTDIKVKIAFITAYRFEHKASEEWSGGKMVATSTVTNDDGTDHVLKVGNGGNELIINGDGKETRARVGVMPASLWHPDTVKRPILLNTLDGHMMKVFSKKVGVEDVAVNGKTVPATHFVMSGELERELWFDDSGTLVQVRFKGSDGSEIVYVLK